MMSDESNPLMDAYLNGVQLPWVLCVEPSRYFANSTVLACTELELEARHVETVSDAIAALGATNPVAIIAGFQLPDLTAASLVAALKSDPTRASIPIAVMSSSAKDGILGIYQPDCVITRDATLGKQLRSFLTANCKFPAEASANQPHVLLVEDSATMQRLAAHILHAAGYAVTIASNGELALEALESSQFDLVLMDIEMPVLDGRETIAEMQANGDTTPVIALTGHDREQFEDTALDLGFRAMCEKPLNKEDILGAVQANLGGAVAKPE